MTDIPPGTKGVNVVNEDPVDPASVPQPGGLPAPARDLTWPDEQPLDASGQEYPAFVLTDEQRRRWDYSLQAAAALFGEHDESMLGLGATPTRSSSIRLAALPIYNSDIPTGDPQPGDAGAPESSEPSPGEGQTEAPSLPS